MFELDREGPPILSVFGGKITTYRKLAEHALERLGAPGRAWTATSPLPGGDIANGDFAGFVEQMGQSYDWLPAPLLQRLCRAYGTRITTLIGDAASLAEMGEHFGGGLYACEVAYLREHEFARSAQDVLWRRSKLGLHLPAEAAARVEQWLAAQ